MRAISVLPLCILFGWADSGFVQIATNSHPISLPTQDCRGTCTRAQIGSLERRGLPVNLFSLPGQCSKRAISPTVVFQQQHADVEVGVHALIRAVKKSDCPRVVQLLVDGVDPNCFNEWGVSCLQLAVKKGSKEIVASLLGHGANVNRSDMDGDTTSPLHLAAQLGDLKMVELLVQNGAGMRHGSA